jgi:hypothetical protein
MLPLVVLLGLLLVGLLRARANTDDPALLRWQVWQLLAGGILALGLLAHAKLGLAVALPNLGLKTVGFVLALVLALVLVLRKLKAERAAADL